MLYDTSSEMVDLEKEIEYINKYIELQKLSIEEGVKISFMVNGNTRDKKIEPMLLIPLVENAFKHGINYRNKTPIDIQLDVEGNKLSLSVENHFEENKKATSGNSGIGLNNLQKRLNALYPGTHELSILKDTGNILPHLN
jgi:LytS/YehU family sensor histidine kinase